VAAELQAAGEGIRGVTTNHKTRAVVPSSVEV